MHPSRKAAASAALAITMIAPAFAQAAELNATQRTALQSLLQSFGVSSTTITKVENIIRLDGRVRDTASTTRALSPGQAAKAACIALRRDLGPGASGDDVKKLQDLLREDDGANFTVASTGFFGPMTMRAMARYQMKHGIASTTTGYVGPLTRAFLMRSCGKGLDGEQGMRARLDNSGRGSWNSGKGSDDDDSSDDDDDDDEQDEDEDEDDDD